MDGLINDLNMGNEMNMVVETETETDLNLNNYDTFDILGLFELPYDYGDHNLKQAQTKLDKIKAEVADINIVKFYDKAYTSLNCLHKFRENRKLSNPKYLNNNSDDSKLIKAVVSKEDTSHYDSVLTLLQEILNSNEDLNVIYNHDFKPEPPAISINKGTNYFDMANNKNNVILDTYSNPAAPGKVNSLKRIIQYKNLHLNSCFRDKYYNSNPCDFQYSLPSEIKNVLSIRLASIEIPNAWYLYSYLKGNNRFKIEITCPESGGIGGKGGSGSKSKKSCKVYDIIIPDGNYNSETLIEYLNKTYFYLSNDDNCLKNLQILVNPYNNKTEIKLLDSKCDLGIKFSLHFTEDTTESIMNTLGWTLGFRLAKYLKIEDSVHSEGLFDAGGDRYIYFSLNDYQYNVNENNLIFFDETTIHDNVLAKIPTVNGKLCLIVDEGDGANYTKTRRYNGPVNLKKMHIRIMDKFGDIIDLNNMDFSFTFELEILYERNSIV